MKYIIFSLFIVVVTDSCVDLQVSAGYLMRRAAVDFGTSLLTNIKYAIVSTYL